jgi:MFS transporter, DHA3 family, tetracycline resistance protein
MPTNQKQHPGFVEPLRVYLLMRGINAFAFALVLTYELAYHTVVVQLNPLQLVLVGVVLESMTFVFEIPTGMIADLYSRRFSVILGIFLIGSGFLVEALIPSFAVVLLAQVLWGIGFTFYSGAEAAWISDEIGVERANAAFLRATQIGQVASIVGTFLGALLALFSIPLPVLSGAILLLLLGIWLCFSMPETGFQPQADTKNSGLSALLAPLQATLSLIRVRPMLWSILLLGIIIGLSLGGFDRLYTAHLLMHLAFLQHIQLEPVVWLGIINGSINFGSLIGSTLVRRYYQPTDQSVIIRILSMFYSGMIVGSIAFAVSGNFVLAVAGFCLSQILRTISRPLLLGWVNLNAEPAIRATVISTYWQSNAFGQIIGSPLLGWLGAAHSIRLALAVGTAIYTAVLPVLLLARKQQPPR